MTRISGIVFALMLWSLTAAAQHLIDWTPQQIQHATEEMKKLGIVGKQNELAVFLHTHNDQPSASGAFVTTDGTLVPWRIVGASLIVNGKDLSGNGTNDAGDAVKPVQVAPIDNHYLSKTVMSVALIVSLVINYFQYRLIRRLKRRLARRKKF